MKVQLTTMTSLEITQEAIFIGANKQNFVSDYNPTNNIIAFGAANIVALWNPLSKSHNGVYHTLKKHESEVTGVKFIPNSPYLVSIGEDHIVNVWRENGKLYEFVQSLQDHTHSVTCIAVINENIFITGGSDHNIIIWVFNEAKQEFEYGNKFQVKSNYFPLALALQDIDTDNYLVAVGGTNNNIYIYTFEVKDGKVSALEKKAELTGHEDWVKCLQFVTEEPHKNYILASGSQDRYVRLWRLKLNDLIDDSDEDPTKLVLLSNKQYKFELANGSRAAFSFEALIMGHDDWISGLQWHPSCKVVGQDHKLQLLTCTADTALMIWEMDVDSGIWVCVSRLGEMSVKGASTATGASGGFWSCLWFIDPSTKEHYVLASGKTGSFRVYKSDENGQSFESVLGITGAVKDVNDIKWSVNGDYFTATSLDQTTRLYAPWKREGFESWHEFARPQIHGYDMICYDNISPTKFVSGGDEKILRVFEMTKSISKLLQNLCGTQIVEENEQLPITASLPVLGLSNKAENQIEQGDQQDVDNEDNTPEAAEDVLASLDLPPVEEYLQRYTLFPELEKLYGHGYEISCCATSPDGKLIASACRSNNAKHAVIRVFNVAQDYQQSQQVLLGHNLTISSLEFSPDGKYLLAVSRDRQFSLWEVINEQSGSFKLVELNSKAHARILWDCSWFPVGDSFTTVSRDKQIKLWKVSNDKVEMVVSTKLNDAITSVSVYKGGLFNNQAIVAVGLEDGGISIFAVDVANPEFRLISIVDKELTPSNRIEKLSFSNKLHNGKLLLGVGSKDTSARLYSIDLTIFT